MSADIISHCACISAFEQSGQWAGGLRLKEPDPTVLPAHVTYIRMSRGYYIASGLAMLRKLHRAMLQTSSVAYTAAAGATLPDLDHIAEKLNAL